MIEEGPGAVLPNPFRMDRRTVYISLVAAAVLGLSVQPVSSAASGLPTWIRDSPAGDQVLRTILANRDKTPPEFFTRLDYALPDGTLQVMVSLVRRTPAVESFVRSSTSRLRWYGDGPAFFGRVDQQQLARLLRSPLVEFVEPDYPITNFLSTAAVHVHARTYGEEVGMWSFDGTDLRSEVPELTAGQATGKGVVVAVTDSGIDGTHRDFDVWDCAAGSGCKSRILRKVMLDEVTGGDGDERGFPTTDFASGHGTHTAGIVAGNGYYSRAGDADPSDGGDGHHFGMAPQASLISVKVGDSQSAALGFLALQWQVEHAHKYDIRISSNSWGCMNGCSFDSRSAGAMILRRLYEEGVLVTIAAGNAGDAGNGSAFNGAAQSPYVLGVAAYDDGGEEPVIADFSSRGVPDEPLPDPETWTPQSETAGYRRPDLSAPGVYVWSASNNTGGTSSITPRTDVFPYVPMSGTSMATPMVSGAAAVLMSACPNASTLEVMRSLMRAARARQIMATDGSRPALSHETGYGGLDARGSFDWLRARPSCSGAAGPRDSLTPRLDAPPAGIVRQNVTFDGTRSSVADGSITRYEWDFGDGAVGSGAVTRHVFKKPGLYEVTLTVHDDAGSSASRRRTIAVSRPLTYTAKGHIEEGTYMTTVTEFNWRCPNLPSTQGLDGYVFTLPDDLPGRPQSISLRAAPANDTAFLLYASVATGDCDMPIIARTEQRHRITLDLPPGTRYVVAHARGGRDIDLDLAVYPTIAQR